MLVEWLYQTTIEMSLLIGLVLLIRPFVRRLLGARVACWLWFIPLVRAVLPHRPQRPQIVIESIGQGTGSFDVFPASSSFTMPDAIPWEGIWIAGVVVWLALKLLAWLRFRAALAASATPLESVGPLPASMPCTPQALRVRFLATDLPGAPFVTGLLDPRVCLPQDFAERFSPEQQAWVIQHELMHVARRDLWLQLVWELLRAAFWFNPVVHMAARAARDDQELACDQAILGHCGAGARYRYGRTLIASAGSGSHPISIPFFGKHKERIAMIAKHRASGIRNGIGLVFCAALGACALTTAPSETVVQNSGKPITLNVVDLELRTIVMLLADFSRTNIVISDQVPNVNVTMRAEDAPWDEILARLVGCVGAEIGQYSGNVIAIRPSAEARDAGSCGDIQVSGQAG